MMDRIFAILSMLGLIVFMGIVVVFVREPDLIIVTVVGIGVGVVFFWQELKSGGSHFKNESGGDKS